MPIKMLSTVLLLLVTTNTLQAATVATKYPYMNNSAIKFPEENEDLHSTWVQPAKPATQMNTLNNKFGDDIDVHESCKHLTYCTKKPANYPEKKFSEMLKGYKIPPMPTLDVLGNRNNIDLVDDCDSDVTYEPLYTVREKREEPWRIVIQAPDRGYVQKVRLETCRTAGDSCFKPFLPASGFETQCHQVYNRWEVVVKGKDDKSTETIKAVLPVCCSCKYKHMSFLTRFNPDAAKSSISNETKD